MTTASLSDDTLATILICGGLGNKNESENPLSLKEWNGLVRSLMRVSWRPGDLMRWGIAAASEALELDEVLRVRLEALLGQAVVVAAEIERLGGAGIRILSRADDAYPSRWRSRLREQSPPLIYVAGSVSLLDRGGIAAVGSREVDEPGADFARAVGRAAARARTPMISGGARGVDREAMFGALEGGGEAAGIMPDGLARTLRAPDVRQWVADGQLVLVSPHQPNSRFEVWKAMGRNKLIYALADISVVISSDAGRGGTWAGATENLRHDWSPLFVRSGEDVPEGNRQLIELGALPLAASDLEASSNGDLLTSLLDRVDSVPRAGSGQLTQQPLLNGDAAHPKSPPGERSRDRMVTQDDAMSAAPLKGQLELL